MGSAVATATYVVALVVVATGVLIVLVVVVALVVDVVLAVAVGAAVLSGVEPVLPVHLGASSLTIGLLFGLAALAAIIANPIVGRYVSAAPPRLLIAAGVIAVAAALIVIGFAAELWQTSIGMILLGVSSALLLAPATTMISEQGFRSDPPTLGGSYSLYNLAYAAGLASKDAAKKGGKKDNKKAAKKD